MTDGLDWTPWDACPKEDHDAVASLMVEHLTWARGSFRDEFGVDDPPADPDLVRSSLTALRRPDAVILLANHSGRSVDVGAAAPGRRRG
jgi:hypothetical protein